MAHINIREETETDQPAIRTLTEAAFRGRPYAGGDEQDVIDRLRTGAALTLSLVAVEDNEVVGQITFSPASLENDLNAWFALGPVSVLPSRQSEGIGSALINEGLDRIKDMGASGCILTGDPNYYKRFGFKVSPQNSPTNESPEYFQLKLLNEEQPAGRFRFHAAFYGDI
jgi:putative acetyltransferase